MLRAIFHTAMHEYHIPFCLCSVNIKLEQCFGGNYYDLREKTIRTMTKLIESSNHKNLVVRTYMHHVHLQVISIVLRKMHAWLLIFLKNKNKLLIL